MNKLKTQLKVEMLKSSPKKSGQTLLETHMMAIGLKVKDMVKVFIHMLVEMFMLAAIKMVVNMGKETLIG